MVAEPGVYRAESNGHGALSVQTDGGLLGVKPGEFEVLPPLHWVVVGCESGPSRRPCELEWVRSVVEQCAAAGVKCFVKQLDLDGRVSHDPAEWPDWAVREYPDA